MDHGSESGTGPLAISRVVRRSEGPVVVAATKLYGSGGDVGVGCYDDVWHRSYGWGKSREQTAQVALTLGRRGSSHRRSDHQPRSRHCAR